MEGNSFYPVQNGKHFLEHCKGRDREICPQVHGKLGQMPSLYWQEVPENQAKTYCKVFLCLPDKHLGNSFGFTRAGSEQKEKWDNFID